MYLYFRKQHLLKKKMIKKNIRYAHLCLNGQQQIIGTCITINPKRILCIQTRRVLKKLMIFISYGCLTDTAKL